MDHNDNNDHNDPEETSSADHSLVTTLGPCDTSLHILPFNPIPTLVVNPVLRRTKNVSPNIPRLKCHHLVTLLSLPAS